MPTCPSGRRRRGVLLLFEADASEAEHGRGERRDRVRRPSRREALEAQADVVFPAPVYAEKEGTVTHPDGRLQRVRQALGHAGESRPGWWVLEDLCGRLGAGTGAAVGRGGHRAGRRRGALLRRHHARRDRRRGRALAGPRGRVRPPRARTCRPTALEQPPAAPEGLRARRRAHALDRPEVEHSPSLRFLDTGPRVLDLPGRRRASSGLSDGDRPRSSANGDERRAPRSSSAPACPRAACSSSPLDAGSEGPVEVRAREAVAG